VGIAAPASIAGIVGVASSGIAVTDPSVSRAAIARRVVVRAADRTNST
jgi:hypothetical protein